MTLCIFRRGTYIQLIHQLCPVAYVPNMSNRVPYIVPCAGVQMVPVVVKCRCVGGCYRLPDYWQYSEVEGEEGSGGSGVTGVTGVAGEGDVQLHWRMVDVGRCVGRCPQQVTNPLCIR